MIELKVVTDFNNLNTLEAPYISIDSTGAAKVFTRINFKSHVLATNMNKLRSAKTIIIFKECIFDTLKVSNTNEISLIFENCKFNTIAVNQISSSLQFNDCTIVNILISGVINAPINIYNGNSSEINNIGEILIKDATFKRDIVFAYLRINFFNILNTDFESIIELNEVNIEDQIDVVEVFFKKLVLFDACTFNTKVKLKYVLFESFSHFRNSTFNAGLDLEYCSIDKEMNFYGVKGLNSKVSKENTSRETYRIIKYQFEKLNNRIEANKYHALELEKKKDELVTETPRKWLEYFVFQFHSLSSEHSTNWFLAIVWIFIVGMTSSFLIKEPIWFLSVAFILYHFATAITYNRNFLLSTFLFALVIGVINYDAVTMESVIENISLLDLSSISNDGSLWEKIVVLLNKVALGYLYYQFLMSVRKDTRK